MSDHATESVGAEHDDPTASTTAIVGVVSVVLLAVTVIALETVYYRTAEAEIYRKVIMERPQELRHVQAEQLEQLNGYRWVDEKNQVVSIPIDRAMEKLVAEDQSEGR